jgi:hypothetical protein
VTAFMRLRPECESDGFMLSDDPLEGRVQRNVRAVVTESNRDA